MRIAIDVRRVGDFGVGTYIRNVVRTIARIDHQNEYLLIGEPHHIREFGELPGNFITHPLVTQHDSWRNVLTLQRLLRRYECSVAHVPHLYWMPRFTPCPYVVTVHDLLQFFARERGRIGWRNQAKFQLTRRILRRASRIVAVSHSTAGDISQVFQIPQRKIEVVYNAIDERFTVGHATNADRQMIAQRYQVSYPFVLYAGNVKPHKNVVRLIEAFALLKQELAKEDRFRDLKLIIIGDELSQHPDLRRTVITSRIQHEVRFLGFVPIDVLRIFYDTAKLFAFPSLYEGFGLPPLEAMALGTPVVTSNTTSLPEVVGNAAVLVNPENVFDISKALHRVLTDSALREEMKRRGYEQARRFSWDTSVRRLLAIYREALQTPGTPEIVHKVI